MRGGVHVAAAGVGHSEELAMVAGLGAQPRRRIGPLLAAEAVVQPRPNRLLLGQVLCMD
jgi:hypothetical protein